LTLWLLWWLWLGELLLGLLRRLRWWLLRWLLALRLLLDLLWRLLLHLSALWLLNRFAAHLLLAHLLELLWHLLSGLLELLLHLLSLRLGDLHFGLRHLFCVLDDRIQRLQVTFHGVFREFDTLTLCAVLGFESLQEQLRGVPLQLEGLFHRDLERLL